MKSCRTCNYFTLANESADENEHAGPCHRFPPQVVVFVNGAAGARFPVVSAGDWCGEYETCTLS